MFLPHSLSSPKRRTYSPAFAAAILLIIFHGLSNPASAQTVSNINKRTQTAANASAINDWESGETGRMKVYALRLMPNQDLRKQLELFIKQRKLQAGLILTAVGSLQKVSLRLADQKDATLFDGKYEIVSLVGTLSPDGVHLHISLSDSTGKTIGGHLLEGCEIYTTAEIVIAEARGLLFTREQDAQTGYKELKIHSAAKLRHTPRSRQKEMMKEK
jgi:predicted DNA-binding protein with PD1-like motif